MPDGSRVRVELDLDELVASKAIAKGYIYERDAITENLGYCDAIEADCILQLAVLGSVTYG